MARLGFAGAEVEVAASTGPSVQPDCRNNAGTTTRDTTIFRSGAASLKCAGTAGAAANAQWSLGRAGVAATADVTYYYRFCFYVDALPTGTIVIGRMASTGGVWPVVKLTSGGKLQFWGVDSGGAQIGSDSVATIAAGTWYRVEWAVNFAAAANGTRELRLDDITVASDALGSSVGGTPADTSLITGWLAAPGATANMYVDDVALNDSTGGSQNTWCGDGKVVLLKPISDNAGGTGWTLGTGTALGGNGFTAVANTPPLGVADLAAGSDPKQIRNATSNANVNYDANLTTYRAAGVVGAVRVLLPIVATAAPVVTSAKAGTVGISSNPAIANVALGPGGTAGAFWSGTAGGTYPTGWKWSFGTTTYNPVVVGSSSPVARITQVTASTRIAVVCFLAIYVEYQPLAPPIDTEMLSALQASVW